MNKISYAEIVSSLALLTAIGALVWNIIRDFVVDKVAIEFSITFGEAGNIKNSNTDLFASAGSFPSHYFNNPVVNVQITNTGRRPIGVASVGGELKNCQGLFMAVDGLPKMLQPYEIFSSIANARSSLLGKIQRDEIKNLWVKDTKGKKWLLLAKGWKQLKKTAEYINSNKHIPQS